MKTEHALRYLLLRHLKAFADRVPPELLVEATRSLRVIAERDRYVVTWQARGRPQERGYRRDEFVFYRRGDTKSESRTVDEPLTNDNDALARTFGTEVFGVPAPEPRTGRGEAHEPFRTYEIGEAVALSLAMGTVGGLSIATALALLAVNLVEHAKRGRLWASALFLPLALVGPPLAAVLGAVSYGLLQLLDPDPTQRRSRIGLCASAAVLAATEYAFTSHHPVWPPGSVVIAGLAVVGAVARSLYAMHFRTMPLALPFYALGLYLDGHVTASFVGLAFVLVSTLVTAFGHRWVSVQRAWSLTPNG